MFSLVMAVVLLIIAIVAFVMKSKIPEYKEFEGRDRFGDKVTQNNQTKIDLLNAKNKIQNLAGAGLIVGAIILGGSGAVSYNDAGYCTYNQTAFGQEVTKCEMGWYYSGWSNRTTEYPHFITIANTNDAQAGGTAVSGPYPVRLSDNWNGDVTQTTRFAIPQDEEQFLAMHRTFRSPERLITTTLKPAVTSSLDSVSNLFSMEEYYAGGKRDQYKTEFRDAVVKGRPQVKQVQVSRNGDIITNKVASSSLDAAQDTSNVGSTAIRRVVMQKVTDEGGNVIRELHGYAQYGITVSSAILENLDPDNKFEDQIQARKDAASRRIVAQEQRKEQEEQRLLEIQRGETAIAKRQAQAKVDQIQKTTEAETSKKLALIQAERLKEEAEIAKQTSEINLEKSRIDAEAVQVLADATAYEKQVILEADGALQQKLKAWTDAQRFWANAAAQINVPQTVFASGGEGTAGNALGTVDSFMQMMTMQAAKQLQVDPTITK